MGCGYQMFQVCTSRKKAGIMLKMSSSNIPVKVAGTGVTTLQDRGANMSYTYLTHLMLN